MNRVRLTLTGGGCADLKCEPGLESEAGAGNRTLAWDENPIIV